MSAIVPKYLVGKDRVMRPQKFS
ncbi:hypothetical protein NSPZN2_30173 [Nitrospira defluvii]|uniref:Uncharacterized protein n=1 Tax=Nitrospira defluvii TaxID=330214 RepID=A0ABM8RG41_9BACT|nr:hypothetical protein NSPZN2_30173 [Nitrospira defluvii]